MTASYAISQTAPTPRWYSVNYSPSPEEKYPTAIEEAYAATNYIAKHGSDLNLDASRLAVVGGPRISYQVLFYPVTDTDFDDEQM